MFGAEQALVCRTDHFESSLEILSNALDSSSWYRHWGVRLIVWPGDLVIRGDLVDDDFSPFPALVMCGDLVLRHWLRGGMISFVGGQVRAQGLVAGHYNDSALFVGGDLVATGTLAIRAGRAERAAGGHACRYRTAIGHSRQHARPGPCPPRLPVRQRAGPRGSACWCTTSSASFANT